MTQYSHEVIEYADSEYESEVLEDWPAALGDVLAEVLDDGYADASPEELDDALGNILDSMTAAEAFNFAKALHQIGTSAQRALSDPAVGQVLRTALPLAGGAVGTFVGGPAGTALGSGLGNAVAGALPGAPKPKPPVPGPAPQPAVAGGSAAALQGLIATQMKSVLEALAAAAVGDKAKTSVNGVPVAQILGMLSSVFGQAAADADELMYLDQDGEGESEPDSGAPHGRALYATLLEAENAELAEAVGTP